MMRIARKIRSVPLALATALMLTCGTAFATQPEDGSTWAGVVTTEAGKAMYVAATVTRVAVSLHFGEPGGCRIAAGPLRAAGDVRTYRFGVSQNGGPFCAKLYQRELSIDARVVGTLDIAFQRDKTAWTGKLERVGDK